jgi:hypothetical protein
VSEAPLPGALGHGVVGLGRMVGHRGSVARHGGPDHRRPLNVRPELVGPRGMGRRVGHRAHHVEHRVVALVGDARVEEAAAHAPGALAPVVEAADGAGFGLLGTRLVAVAQLALLELRLGLLPVLLRLFLVVYLAGLARRLLVLCLKFETTRNARFKIIEAYQELLSPLVMHS